MTVSNRHFLTIDCLPSFRVTVSQRRWGINAKIFQRRPNKIFEEFLSATA
jgi:hypothetical protein